MVSLNHIHSDLVHAGIDSKTIQILGVVKGQPVEKVQLAIAAGVSHFGVNYVQEAKSLRKIQEPVTWHFIGHIQSRKVKELIDYDFVQSIDREAVAVALNERLRAAQRRIKILIQINIGNEPQKSGIHSSALEDFLKVIQKLEHLELCGLMGMPPALLPAEQRRPYFSAMKQLFDKHRTTGWNVLSMGTSDDFTIAAQEGATLIRLGTRLFGERPSQTD